MQSDPSKNAPLNGTGRSKRLAATFERLRAQNRAAFVPFIMAGDPNMEMSQAFLNALPAAGADIIELGVCFTDPMADGPAIQAAGLRALASGQTLKKTLAMVSSFRETDTTTPIILMGYYNPFFAMGVETFLEAAAHAGVDGLIIVDLPPEEDDELCLPAAKKNIDFIRLATPTTDAQHLPDVLSNTSGFVYYVSVAGITGQKSGDDQAVKDAVTGLRETSGLPVAVGFGIKTTEKAATIAQFSDAVVVGSALVDELAKSLADAPKNAIDTLENGTKDAHYRSILEQPLTLTSALAKAVRTARETG